MLRNLVLVLLSAISLSSVGQIKNPVLQKLSSSLQRRSLEKKGGDSLFISLSARNEVLFPFLQKKAAADHHLKAAELRVAFFFTPAK